MKGERELETAFATPSSADRRPSRWSFACEKENDRGGKNDKTRRASMLRAFRVVVCAGAALAAGSPAHSRLIPADRSNASPTPTPTPMPKRLDGRIGGFNGVSGDCNQDAVVTIDELVRSVGIALGLQALANCQAADVNSDGRVTIDELIRAVNVALNGARVDQDRDGFSESEGDCDDANPAVHPQAAEVCNGIDDDCDDETDEEDVCGGLPPDPADVAPPVAAGVATSIGAATAFLYTGGNPIQTGVAPGTIEPQRAAVLRGKVLTPDSAALSGVSITILDHPEFGRTLSRADGMFDMAVNGGGLLTVNYEKAGFCPVQRQVTVPWQDFAMAPDVVMTALDPMVTSVALGTNSPMQMHQGSMQTDADGARHAMLLFMPGTSAGLVMPDGATQPVSALHIRATEFTVGPNGPAAMPAILPPNSGYTYAVELSADEAMAQGASDVQFDRPVFSYLENFVGFPVGMAVPAGFYDRRKAAWVPSQNGRVIGILSIAGGLADVDTDGDGNADTGEGITDAERRQLATLSAAGQTLWRVPVTHFTPWDYNWPYGPPDDAVAGGGATSVYDPQECAIEVPGSIIECENQVLGESVAIVGTPHRLNYRSDRVPGRPNGVRLRLSGASVPASLIGIGVRLSVAGQSHQLGPFPPNPNQEITFEWDGLDAYDRSVQSARTITGSIDYLYPVDFKEPGEFAQSFARFGGGVTVGNRLPGTIILSTPFSVLVGEGLTDARSIGLGGWTLGVHHFYDPTAQVLHTGDGRRRSSAALRKTLEVIARSSGFVAEVRAAPDGTVYFAIEVGGDRVTQVLPDGTVLPFAGTGTPGFNGDGMLATSAELSAPHGLALGPDGAVYIADTANQRVRRVGSDGLISTVAGTGTRGFSGDGGPATEAQLNSPYGVAVAADGTLYISDVDSHRVRQVTPDGIIHTIAGTGTPESTGDGGPATAAQLSFPVGLALGLDGSLFIAEFAGNRVRRIAPDGIITTFAGNGDFGLSGDGGQATAATVVAPRALAVGPDGSVYIADGGNTRVRVVRTDGVIFTLAEIGGAGVDVSPSGDVYATSGSDVTLRRVKPALVGFTDTQITIASANGSELYAFDAFGRHLRTLDTLTGATLFEFGYDAEGRLNQVTEKTGGTDNVTTILHDAAGNPTAIVGPFGQQTTLAVDANGFLDSITNPAGEEMRFTSSADGLLTSYADPRGKTSMYMYDAEGRLIHNADPAGGTQDLAQVGTASEFSVTRTTALARTTTHKTENLPGNVQRRAITAPDDTEFQSEEAIDAATTHATSSDGTTTDVMLGADTRFGMQSPVLASSSIQFPSGLQSTITSTRSADLSNPADPLSLARLTETTTVDGRTATNTYTAATRTFVNTTPAGRTQTFALDALGRLVQGQLTGLEPVNIAYDNRGRLASLSLGSTNTRSLSFTYNAQGYVDTLMDSSGRSTHFAYDGAGRVTSKTLPDGRILTLGYDSNGNLTSLTPPGRPAHTVGYSDRNELTRLTPPGVPGTGPTTWAYDVDRAITTLSRPGGDTVTIGYDVSGRQATRAFATGGITRAIDTFSYDAAGRIISIATGNGVNLGYSYDGALLVGESWSGSVVGSVTRTYDTSLRFASESINGANAITNSYDDDDLLTGAGDLIIVRDPQHGLPTSSTLGVVSSALTYNGFGEVTNYSASAGGSLLYSAGFSRDVLGRIAQKTETAGGVTDTFTYTYDVAGQLTAVAENGTTVERYVYDTNGNRTDATVGGVDVSATYDAQDRLQQSGAIQYTYNASGQLSERTDGVQETAYEYDALDNLHGVTLPDGTAITYVLDGEGRRIGKRVNGTLVQGLLYGGDALRPAAELDGSGTIVSRFVYGNDTVPAYLIKGDVAFRLVTDQVGSVKLVVNSNTGAIVQRLDYDSFGNVTLDTSPGFQPFGFAGGLYDPDTKLVHFGAREYDSEAGRWTAKDPILFAGYDANLYRYVSNDPINQVDPLGTGILLDVIGGYLGALMDSYTMMTPLLRGFELLDFDSNAILSLLGVDTSSTTFIVSNVACELIGGGFAGADAIAERRLAESLVVDSTEEMLEQQIRLNKKTFERALASKVGPRVEVAKQEILQEMKVIRKRLKGR
jgi:RHS repeat-associated protein